MGRKINAMKKLNITLEGNVTYRGKTVRATPTGLPKFINDYELGNIHAPIISYVYPVQFYKILGEKR